MKKYLFLIFAIALQPVFSQKLIRSNKSSVARSFYVSSSGNTNDESSSLHPITLAKFLTVTLRDRDEVYFNKGEIFEFGDYTITGHAVKFKSYGSGANPMFTGSRDVGSNSWTNEGSGIYSTVLSSVPSWVFINGSPAKQAESGFITMTANSSGSVIQASSTTLNAYNSVQSLVGAKVRFKQYDFRVQIEYTITAYDTGTGNITLDAAPSCSLNYPMWIYGQKQFISANGDWFYETGTQKLYVKAASSPAGTDIRIGFNTLALTCNGYNDIVIDGIDFRNFYDKAIVLIKCNRGTINNCTISNQRYSGIAIYGNAAYTITNNSIHDLGFYGIGVGSTQGSTISYNSIYNIGEQANLPWPLNTSEITGGTAITFVGDSYSENWFAQNNTLYEYNTLYELGYQGIQYAGNNIIIRKNLVHDFCKVFNDGGAFHGICRLSLKNETKNTLIEKNVIYHGVGNLGGITGGTLGVGGIYIDNGHSGAIVQYNTVYDVQYNCLINWDTEKTTVQFNNFVDATGHCIKIRENTNNNQSPIYPNQVTNIFTNNVFATRSGTTGRLVGVASYQSVTSFNPFTSGGNSDNNRYIQPYATNINTYQNIEGGASTQFTLSGWQTKFSLDASSTSMTNYITYSNGTNALQEVKVEINMTDNIESFTLPAGYKQPDGTVGGTVSINPWCSFVYLKQTSFP
jgi:parallel beta-helix repeat protein